MQTSLTTYARIALAVYVLALAVVLFQPTPEIASGTVLGVDDLLVRFGFPEAWVAPGRVEFVLNALMFAPVPFLGAWVFPGLRWTDWVAYTFLASSAVELTQGVLLSARSAQFVDIVANTLGGVIGAGVIAIVVALLPGAAWLPRQRT
ncbi:VanZ family protein [Nocardioides jishulii]|uniref:VanZ family protein n=1 Tax=Nocardioides jishulii TaxID=2575440 RepID=UPI001484EC9A|nr:VanZ family protein [Nocardioides jishulii]